MICQTSRLIISKFTVDDAPFFLELVNTPNWIQYIGDRNLKTVEQAENYLKNGSIKSYREFGYGFYKLQLKDSQTPIGTCGLVKRDYLEYVDIGFAMLPDYEKKGFGYEASIAVLELAKTNFNLDKVSAITTPTNTNSIKLLEKLGLSFEKRIKPFEDDEELLLFAKTI